MATLTRAVRDRLWHILLAGLLVILGLVVYTIVQLGSMRSTQAQQARVVTALSSNLAGAQSQLKAHGIEPAQPPPAQIIAQAGPPGPAGATGPGPSDEQIATAVSAYLQQHPIAGQPPTTDQIAAVVAVYLAQHPAPSGSPGSPGPTGAVGAGPSDAQIASAVAVWEQGHPSVGPSGPSGPAGAIGPSGPAGAAGTSGAAGPTGQPGSPGPSGPSGPSGAPGQDPSGWTYKDALGLSHTCAPDSETPAPQYTCS